MFRPRKVDTFTCHNLTLPLMEIERGSWVFKYHRCSIALKSGHTVLCILFTWQLSHEGLQHGTLRFPGICHLINYLLIRLEVSQVVVYVRFDMLRFETFISLKIIKICVCYYLGLGRLKTTHIIRESLKDCSRRVYRPIGSRPL
jgi:hypothetical protein